MSGERILVVDDNATNLKLMTFVLASKGYETRGCVDADDAIRALPVFRPALILLDLQLPGMDGLTLARRLKSEGATAAIPIIAVTAFAMKGDEERALAAGCNGYVTKPIDTRALPILVAQYIRDGGG